MWEIFSPVCPSDTDDFHRAAAASTSAPTLGQSGKSTLMHFHIHLRQRAGSHYRTIASHGQTDLNLWRHVQFWLAFIQIMNQQVSCCGNWIGKSVNSLIFFPLRKEAKAREELGHQDWLFKQWVIRSNQEGGADGVCVATVMADLFTCSKYQHLTHICDTPVSAETRLL